MRTSEQTAVTRAPRSLGSEHQNLRSSLETATLTVLFTTMAFAPLAFGAVETWSTFVMEMLLGVVALLLIASGMLFPGGGYRHPALAPAGLFVALIVAQVGFNLSFYRHSTFVELLRVVAYGIAFVAALQCLRSSERLRQFTLMVAIFGFALALLAMAQHFTSPDKLYWFRTPSQGGNVFGPFVNRNHYAGFMEMVVPFGIMGFLVPYTRKEKRAMMFFAAIVMAGSLVLSLSRGGLMAFLAELVFLGVVISLGTKFRKSGLAMGALVVPVAAFVGWLSTPESLERFTIMQDWMRSAITRDGLRIFRDHWVMGTGLGTFPTIYPQFRSFSTDYFVNQAHNDIVQLMVETGLPGLLLVLWFLVVVYRNGLAKGQMWTSAWKGAASLAAVTGITGLVVHSLVDFNLRIPSNALWFCVLCGVAAAREREKALLIETSPRFHRSPTMDIEVKK
jgi:O-antigen ligase